MKIISGEIPDESLRVIGNSGKDITSELDIKKLTIFAENGKLLRVVMDVYVDEVEAETTQLEIRATEHKAGG
ncbi:MAG: hypothetical protein DRJ50_09120 [Actinobacteria bacterium]|nr:MAG: hypothetical protein DRJ50_09120 [Actinomycetota bacterium]